MAEEWRQSLDNMNKNSISRLQEYAVKKGCEVRYEDLPCGEGYNCNVYFEKFIATGTGRRIKEAKEAAADRALRSLNKNNGTNKPTSYQPPVNCSREILYDRQSFAESESDEDGSDASDVAVPQLRNESTFERLWNSSLSVYDGNLSRRHTNVSSIVPEGKNPVSALMEYGQANREDGRFEEESRYGPSHNPTFTMVAYLGKRKLGEGTGSSIKKAKRNAAEASLKMLKPMPSSRALTFPGFSLTPSQQRPIDKNAGICPAGADPISILNEYAQKKGLKLTFPDPDISGSDHERTFTVRAKLGNTLFSEASATKIKEAEREASRNALRRLQQMNLYQFGSGLSTFSITQPLTFHDRIAKLCHEKFDKVVADIPVNLAGRKVIAGVVMETKTTKTYDVISIASGNRFIKGDRLTTDGQVLIDSHAEILAVRGMRKFLYHHLTKLSNGEESSVLQRHGEGKAELLPDIRFHLYISTAPCGDGAIFTHSSGQSEVENCGSHMPIFEDKNQGLLRTKIEQGQGEIPTKTPRVSIQYQGLDTVRQGERLRVMSCSDKICKWNILGMQGALLATLMKPVYFRSITFGNLYNHGHMARAMCCRIEKSCEIATLPDDYKVNHPLLGAVSRNKDPPRNVEKSTAYCINWNTENKEAEVTDGPTGVQCTNSGWAKIRTKSQLCKHNLIRCYKNICRRADLLGLVKDDYLATKRLSKQYQRCKILLYESFYSQGYGTWVGLPRECQQFRTSLRHEDNYEDEDDDEGRKDVYLQ